MKIKIYGLKRSGTNLLEWVLTQMGHHVMVNEGAWKHAGPEEVEGAEAYVMVLKHPFNWYGSIRRHQEPRGEPSSGVEDWVSAATKFLSRAEADPGRWILVRYEDFVTRWGKAMARLEEAFGGIAPVVPPHRRMNKYGAPDPGAGQMDREEFISGKFCDRLTPQEFDMVMDKVGGLLHLWEDMPRLHTPDRSRPVVNLYTTHAGVGDCVVALRVRDMVERAGAWANLYLRRNLEFAKMWSKDVYTIPYDFKKRSLPYGSIRIDREVAGADRNYTHIAADLARERLPIEVAKKMGDPVPLHLRTVAEPFPLTEGAVLMFPFAAWRNREYPAHLWEQVAVGLRAAGQRVIVLGSEDRQDIAAFWPVDGNICGGSWARVVASISVAKCVVCCDSGPLHVAAQMGAPTVAVHAMFSPKVLTEGYPSVVSVYPGRNCCGCGMDPMEGYETRWCNAEPAHWRPGAPPSGCPELVKVEPARVVEAILEVCGNRGNL